MSSRRYTRVSSSNTSSSNTSRLSRMRPIATAAKKVTSKVKSIRVFRIFRTRTSTETPFAEREIKYVSQHYYENGTGKTASTAKGTQVGQREIRILSNVGIAVPGEQWKPSSEEMRDREIDRFSVTECDHIDERYGVVAANEEGVSDSGPASHVIEIKELRSVSQEQQFATQFTTECDSPSDEANAAIWTLEVDREMSCETFYTAMSEANHTAKWSVHELENVLYCEIESEQPEPRWPAVESDKIQEQSFDLSTNDTAAKLSLLDSGIRNDTSSVFDSTVTGTSGEINCETANSNDDVEPIQSLKENEPLALGKFEDVPHTDIDKEKAERIERRRELLAKKKEARLKKAMVYDAREAAKAGNTYSKGPELKSCTESSVIEKGTYAESTSWEESKTEEEFEYLTEQISDRAEWSKQEARMAKERRKHGQKERLLNLLSGCIISHKGSAFGSEEKAN